MPRTISSGPAYDITHMTMLQPGEILAAIRIPGTWAGAEHYFEKVRDRQVWDFPLVNVASAMKVSGGTIQALRIAVGAVAATPRAIDRGGGGRGRSAAHAGDREAGGRARHCRRAGAAAQRLQDPADAQPGHACNQRICRCDYVTWWC